MGQRACLCKLTLGCLCLCADVTKIKLLDSQSVEFVRLFDSCALKHTRTHANIHT